MFLRQKYVELSDSNCQPGKVCAAKFAAVGPLAVAYFARLGAGPQPMNGEMINVD